LLLQGCSRDSTQPLPSKPPRYAETTGRRTVAEWLKVAKTNDIAPGEAKAVDIGARRIALFNIEGTYHAIDDTSALRLSRGTFYLAQLGTFHLAATPLKRTFTPGRGTCYSLSRPHSSNGGVNDDM
jgi:hypothetical protein